MSDVTYRWIDGITCPDDLWKQIDEVLAKRNWMAMSRDYTRLLLAEQNGETAFCAYQGLPYCGPLFVPKSMRGSGVAQELANGMVNWLLEIGARGWIAVAESPYAEKFCQEHGMVRVNYPVYVMPMVGGLDVDTGRTQTTKD
jgi:hypothetical protein